jgi:hypothetical protein
MQHMKRIRRRPSAVLALALITLVLPFAVPASVSADSGPGPKTVTVTAVPIAQPGQVAPATPITCTITIDDPHISSHNPENVNVVSHWSCTASVQSLSLTTTLYLGVVQVAQTTATKYNSYFQNSNAAASCANGSYLGSASGTIVFPPGYVPQTETAGPVWSDVVPITC